MTYSLRDRIVAVVADELYRQGSTDYAHRYTPMDDEGNDLPELIGLDASIDPRLVADAVMQVVSDEYINSRGMFHEPDRCLGCEECEKEWLEDESRWIRD